MLICFIRQKTEEPYNINHLSRGSSRCKMIGGGGLAKSDWRRRLKVDFEPITLESKKIWQKKMFQQEKKK